MYKSLCGRLYVHTISYQWGALSSLYLDSLLPFSLDSWKGPDLLKSVCGIKQIRPLLCGSAFQPAILPQAITFPICVDLSLQINTWVLRILDM